MPQPVRDNVSVSAGSQSAPSISWSHTITSNTNGILLVGTLSSHSVADDGITGVTYGAAPLTLIPGWSLPGPSFNSVWGSAFYLLAPAVGTDTITVSFVGNLADDAAGAASYTGVDQTTPFGTLVTATGTGATATVDVPSAATDLIFSASRFFQVGVVTAGGGVSAAWDGHAGSDTNYRSVGGDAPGTGGNVTMSWSTGGTPIDWVIGGIPLKAAASPVTSTALPFITTMRGQFLRARR